MPLIKNQSVVLDIIDFSFEGLGVAKLDGTAIFVYNAIVGEKVRAKILTVKKHYAFAKTEEVLTASSDRVTPPCEYFPRCGGCTLQHLSYERELDFKKDLIRQAFNKENISIDGLSFNIVASNSEYHCRNKCSLPIRKGKNNDIQIGFFRKKSHEIIDINECVLQSHSIKELIFELKEWMNANKILPYYEETHSGNLRHITLRILGGKAVVCLVGTKPLLKTNITNFTNVLYKIFNGNFSLYYNYNPDKTNVIYGKEFNFLSGTDEPIETDGLLLRVHPAGFFQVNDYIRKKLFNRVEELVKKTGAKVIIEAYAGQGVLASKLHKTADKLYAIEICKESIDAGLEMKELNAINNLHYIQGDCGTELDNLFNSIQKNSSKEVEKIHFQNNISNSLLILDPPRSGVCQKVLSTVKTHLPPYIIYISCNPATLARNIATLLPYYKITHLEAFDMFPKTTNVETLVMLEH